MIPLLRDEEYAKLRPTTEEVLEWQKSSATIALVNYINRLLRPVEVAMTATENAMHSKGFDDCRKQVMTLILQGDKPGFLVAELPEDEPPKATYPNSMKERC